MGGGVLCGQVSGGSLLRCHISSNVTLHPDMGADLVGDIALAGVDSAGDLIAHLPEQCSMFTASDGFRSDMDFGREEVEGDLAIKHVHNDRHVPVGLP